MNLWIKSITTSLINRSNNNRYRITLIIVYNGKVLLVLNLITLRSLE